MTTNESLRNKIREVLQNIKIVDKYQNSTLDEIESDQTLSGAIQHYLYITCQSAIDLGEMYIEFSNYRVPYTYSDVFDVLFEQKVIDQKLATTLRNMAGFRNILAHQYGKVDFGIIHEVLTKKITFIEKFVLIIEERIS